MCDDPKDFAVHGFGIALYFVLVKFVIYMSLILVIPCGFILILYMQGSTDIKEYERVAGFDYNRTKANQYSIGIGNRFFALIYF